MPAARPIRLAASISVAGCYGCPCGTITIRLHDAAGVIFTAAQMPPDAARSVRRQIEEELPERPAGLRGIRCEGTA